MKSNVIQFEPPAEPADQVEPLEAAVREVSARIAHHIGAARRGYARSYELGSRIPSLRRKHTRPAAPEITRPVTFFSIEEASASAEPEPLQAA